jgi:hypothetical protein
MLADDDLPKFVEQRPRERAGFLDRFVDGIDSCAHGFFNSVFRCQSDKKFMAMFKHSLAGGVIASGTATDLASRRGSE